MDTKLIRTKADHKAASKHVWRPADLDSARVMVVAYEAGRLNRAHEVSAALAVDGINGLVVAHTTRHAAESVTLPPQAA